MNNSDLEQELELLRKKAVLTRNGRVIAAIGLTLIVIGIVYSYAYEFFEFSFFVFILSLVVALAWPNPDKDTFLKVYQERITYATLRSILDECSYEHDKGISEYVIRSTEMMNTGDRFSSNDYISGKYKDVKFDMSDIEIEEQHKDSDGDTTYTTIFKGQWYIIDFNKPFKANFQIVEKDFRSAIVKRGLFVRKEERKNKVEVEDIEFNKQFNIYALNDLDVFYVLTPKIIEKIKEVNNRIPGSLLLCFVDNKLHIGLNNGKDLFEASINRKVRLANEVEKTKKEISIITDFIDILNLDNDLFDKEKEV